jgi:hypothetical protein
MGCRGRLDNLICFGLVVTSCRRLAILAGRHSSMDAARSRVSRRRSVAFAQSRMRREGFAENGAALAGS